MEIKEGEFYQGDACGYQRQLIAFNGHCRLGYFRLDEPYGKFVEYDRNGDEFHQPGIYRADNDCIERQPIKSFEENILPETILEKRQVNEQDYVPVNYHLNRKGSRLIGPESLSMNQSYVSDISNLTAKEQEVLREKEQLEREIQERLRMNLQKKMTQNMFAGMGQGSGL